MTAVVKLYQHFAAPVYLSPQRPDLILLVVMMLLMMMKREQVAFFVLLDSGDSNMHI